MTVDSIKNNTPHLVLARKWRPKTFSDLVGQESCTTVLKNIICSGRLHHAYLLTGTRGVGKTTIARIIGKALNCESPNDYEPCGTCNSCKEIDSNNFIDVIEIDAASNTGVDNVRELIENAKYCPTEGKYKVYIIDEVHMLSKAAFNAMLKTLEEPPSLVIFILATTDLQKVPITVLSRCLQLKLRNLSVEEIANRLSYIATQEKIDSTTTATQMIAEVANGSMRDALSLFDQAIAYSGDHITEQQVEAMLGITNSNTIMQIIAAIKDSNGGLLVKIANELYAQGMNLTLIMQQLSKKFCELSILQLTGSGNDAHLKQFKDEISINDVQLYFEICNLATTQMAVSNNVFPLFIMHLLRMVAFTIGSDTQKNIVITSHNFKSCSVDVDSTNHLDLQTSSKPLEHPENSRVINVVGVESETHIQMQVHNTPKILEEAEIQKQAKQVELQKESEEIKSGFDLFSIETVKDPNNLDNSSNLTTHLALNKDSWHNLIDTLKPITPNHVYPILSHTQFNNCDTNTLDITIDKRYETSLVAEPITTLEKIFSEHFCQKISIKHKFDTNIEHSLSQKKSQEQQEKQRAAESAISNDRNLIQILERFSGKIISGSIKPVTP